MIKFIVEQVEKIGLSNGVGFMTWFGMMMGCVGAGVAFEDWDVESTENTQATVAEFEAQIEQASTLKADFEMAQKRYDIFKYDNKDADYEIRSQDWIEYMATKTELEQSIDQLETQNSELKEKFWHNLAVSTDVPENKWASLITAFEKTSGQNIGLDQDSAYVVRECQIEYASTAQNQDVLAHAVMSCVRNEIFQDGLKATACASGGMIGLSFLLGVFNGNRRRIDAWVDSREAKKKARKAQKNRTN